MRFPFQITKDRQFDCAGFGENAADHLITAPRLPEFDTKLEVSHYVQAAGGQIASTLVGLQRLGRRTIYAGRFGGGAEGKYGFDTLAAEGVNMRFAEIVPDARTHISFIIIDETTGERTILWQRDARLAYTIEEAPAQLPAQARVLHIDAHDPEATLGLAMVAREHGTIVSADFDRLDAGVVALLPFVDVLITSKEFPHLFTGVDDEHEALIETKQRTGSHVVGMTRGVRGALLLVADTFIETPALPVPGGTRDTTGAGDAFHAGFIYGMLTGAEIEESLRYGAAVAALKCRRLGARAGLPTRAELKAYLAQVG